MMKTLFLLTVSLILSASIAHAVEVDGIAAQVGSQTILKSEVYEEMRRQHADQFAYERVLNDMIDRRLILAAAQDSKMTMQEWVVENRIREIVQRSFGGDRNRLMDTLAKQRVSYPEWRQQMKDDMIIGGMRWQMVDKNIDSTPAEMRAEFEGHPERYRSGGKVSVSVILLKPESKNLRDEVTAALATNDFASVAKQYSADSHASEGGVWKDVVPSDCFRKEVCDELSRLNKGELSRWIDIDGWSFLLRKDDETAMRQLSFDEAYEKVEGNVREEQAKRLYLDWVGRLRAATFIKIH